MYICIYLFLEERIYFEITVEQECGLCDYRDVISVPVLTDFINIVVMIYNILVHMLFNIWMKFMLLYAGTKVMYTSTL